MQLDEFDLLCDMKGPQDTWDVGVGSGSWHRSLRVPEEQWDGSGLGGGRREDASRALVPLGTRPGPQRGALRGLSLAHGGLTTHGRAGGLVQETDPSGASLWAGASDLQMKWVFPVAHNTWNHRVQVLSYLPHAGRGDWGSGRLRPMGAATLGSERGRSPDSTEFAGLENTGPCSGDVALK